MERIKGLAADDHRNFNRRGECFDKGETFSGLGEVLEDIALPAAADLAAIAAENDLTLVELALAFVLDCEGVSVVIPGCRTVSQVNSNCAIALKEPLNGRKQSHLRPGGGRRRPCKPLTEPPVVTGFDLTCITSRHALAPRKPSRPAGYPLHLTMTWQPPLVRALGVCVPRRPASGIYGARGSGGALRCCRSLHGQCTLESSLSVGE
eukprot:scaffold3_cov389-Prasinococcus_capsulatus_cf.AAC.17